MSPSILHSLHRSGIPTLHRLLPTRHLVVLSFHRVREGLFMKAWCSPRKNSIEKHPQFCSLTATHNFIQSLRTRLGP